MKPYMNLVGSTFSKSCHHQTYQKYDFQVIFQCLKFVESFWFFVMKKVGLGEQLLINNDIFENFDFEIFAYVIF